MADIESQTNKNDDSSDPPSQPPSFFHKPNRPVTLMFHDVTYKIKPKKKSKSEAEKTILKGISGVVRPGEMLAMMGPSGSGKTTLLTALGGRLVGGGGRLVGTITYNGKAFSNKMKRNVGFVTQDDILLPHLTVTETLVFTALLRLPNTLTKQQKLGQAEAVVSQLGLSKCKNSVVGSQTLRGVSGGERKRVSIGQEMLINPTLLFLDEPTSGLDSTTAQRIVSTLWELANNGVRTVVMTIHQPSSRLFYMFHKILLLSEGNTIYFGKGAEAMDYFFSVGYSPSVPMNPSDFLLDLANGLSMNDPEEEAGMVKQKLVSSFKNSNMANKLQLELQDQTNEHLIEDGSEDKSFGRWSTTWWQQFTVLLRRGIKERKHESFSRLKVGQVLAVAFISGLLWWKSDDSHLQDKIGLFYFSSSFWGFFPLLQAISTFPKERMMLEKERSSGMYRLSSYFISRTTSDIPMELVLPTIFILIIYWMAGLKRSAASFFATLFSQLLSVLVSQGFGLAVGALVLDQTSATTLGSVIMLCFLLTSGYFVQHVPPFIAWTKYLSIGTYTYKLLLISQYEATDTYPCLGNRGMCEVGEFPAIKQVGLHGKASAVLALVAMLVGYRLVAYIALMRIGVTKKD